MNQRRHADVTFRANGRKNTASRDVRRSVNNTKPLTREQFYTDPFLHYRHQSDDWGKTRTLEAWGDTFDSRGFFASKGLKWYEARRRWGLRAEEPKPNRFATSRSAEERRMAKARAERDRNIEAINEVAGDICEFVNEHNARVRAKFPNDPRDPGEFKWWTGED
jgi:hypothetical protein